MQVHCSQESYLLLASVIFEMQNQSFDRNESSNFKQKNIMAIVFITLGLLFVIILIVTSLSWKEKMSSINPINGLSFRGCIGINLGDSWELVLSRMAHLDIISQEDAKQYKERYIKSRDGEGCLGETFKSTTKYTNVDFVEFNIKYSKLTSITIHLASEQADMASLLEKCKNILTQQLGSNPIVIKERDNLNERDMYLQAWNSPDGISLVNMDMIENYITLTINPLIML